MDSREGKGKEAGSDNKSVIPEDMRQRENNYRLLKEKLEPREPRDPESSDMPDRSELGEAD